MRYDLHYSNREEKVALLEESRITIGLPIQEFEELFHALSRCNRGRVWFKRGSFEISFTATNRFGNHPCPESSEFELHVDTCDREGLIVCKLSMAELASYFDNEKPFIEYTSGVKFVNDDFGDEIEE